MQIKIVEFNYILISCLREALIVITYKIMHKAAQFNQLLSCRDKAQIIDKLQSFTIYLSSIGQAQSIRIANFIDQIPFQAEEFGQNFALFLKTFIVIDSQDFRSSRLNKLFNSVSVRYCLIELEACICQAWLNPLQSLFLAKSIMECILQINKQKQDKIHLFTQWYALVLQSYRNAFKYLLEYKQEKPQFCHKAQTRLKECVQFSQFIIKECLKDKSSVTLTDLQHYLIVFQLQIINMSSQFKEVQLAAEIGRSSFQYLKSTVSIQILLIKFANSVASLKQDQIKKQQVQFRRDSLYPSKPIVQILKGWLQSRTSLFFTSIFKLRLIAAVLYVDLLNQQGGNIQLLQEFSLAMQLIEFPIRNNGLLGVGFVRLWRVILSRIGFIHNRECQQKVLKAFSQFIKRCETPLKLLILRKLLKQSQQEGVKALIIKQIKQSFRLPQSRNQLAEMVMSSLKDSFSSSQLLKAYFNFYQFLKFFKEFMIPAAFIQRLVKLIEQQIRRMQLGKASQLQVQDLRLCLAVLQDK